MLSVKDIVNQITIFEEEKPKKITFVVDESGSTGTTYVSGMTVLEKESSVVYEYILKHPNNDYNMITFETNCVEHKINIMKDEGLVDLPQLIPKGGTNTHLPLVKINEWTEKPDVVILLTDGETNSSETQLKTEINKFLDKKISLEIIAVSARSVDLNTISQAEERRIPGMDLINYLSNSVDKLIIYNQFHKDEPYQGASSTTINKKCLTFMGCKVGGHVHTYLNLLLDKLDENKTNINWGIQNMNFKQLLSEIGKLLSVYFVSFPSEHFYVSTIINKLLLILNVEEMTFERVYSIMKYGFECTKNKKPILYTNFDQHVKEKTVKLTEFKNAIDSLKINGTTLNSQKTISMPTNGICIINNGIIPLTKNLGPYPKSKDQYDNVYFGCGDDIDAQATRIAFRELCGQLGFRDSRGPEPAFYVLNEMSLMFIKGIELNTEHMIELRKLAIIQTAMETMISKDKYDGVGLYKQWQMGKTVPTHYSRPTHFHSMLFKEQKINPLKLEEPIWWALMMSMLGLFDEQFNNYQTALISKDLNNQNEFLIWIRDTFKDTINGSISLFKTQTTPTSVFTLDNFEPTEQVYVLKKHGQCATNTCYSHSEITNYVIHSGCVWCYHIPSWEDFEPTTINQINQFEELDKLITSSSKLSVGLDLVNSTDLLSLNNKKILINMIGVTGSGKSTSSKKIYDLVVANGGSCLIVSADKWSKKGAKGKQLQSSINKEIRDFDSSSAEHKVIVVDICNENGPSTNCFGFDTNSYACFNFYPNLDKTNFDNYQCWALRNVLMRPAFTPDCLYWLNPDTAGVNVCIKVHNMKINGLKKLLGVNSSLFFSEGLNKDSVMQMINSKADTYQSYLNSKNTDDIITQFIKTTGFPL